MNSEQDPTKIYRAVKYSLFLFSLAFFIFAGSKILNDTIPTAGKAKKLPIYCVDTEEKKVALSFDAAWGNGRYGKRSNIRHSLVKLLYYSLYPSIPSTVFTAINIPSSVITPKICPITLTIL